MEVTLRRCFQKAGFIMLADEDTSDDPVLSMEADVAILPEVNSVDFMQGDLLNSIIDANSENDCSTSAERYFK